MYWTRVLLSFLAFFSGVFGIKFISGVFVPPLIIFSFSSLCFLQFSRDNKVYSRHYRIPSLRYIFLLNFFNNNFIFWLYFFVRIISYFCLYFFIWVYKFSYTCLDRPFHPEMLFPAIFSKKQ
jgi:hypothetical protein